MSFQNENIGMMDEGYFVSRGDIIKWLNDLLHVRLNLVKIEQLGSGAVYCQVIDVIHPGKVNLNKVNWKAKNDYQFINNLRILQDSFKKIGIKRYVQVERLAKAKYQDNLEFAQWLKRYYDLNCGDRGNNYLAEERRGGINPDFGFAEKNVVPKVYNASGVMIPNKKATSPPPKKEMTEKADKPKGMTQSQVPRVATQDRPKRVEKQADKVKEEKVTPVKKEPKKEGTSEKEKELANKVKEMEDKMLMITEIMKSEEDSELKLQLIAELVGVTHTLPQMQTKQEQIKPEEENPPEVEQEGEEQENF